MYVGICRVKNKHKKKTKNQKQQQKVRKNKQTHTHTHTHTPPPHTHTPHTQKDNRLMNNHFTKHMGFYEQAGLVYLIVVYLFFLSFRLDIRTLSHKRTNTTYITKLF